MQNWPEPLRRQFHTLLAQFRDATGNAAWIGIASPELMIGGRFGPRRLGGRLETLEGQPLGRAFVWVQGTEPELWVDPADTGYRDLFDAFAKARLGIPRPTGPDWNVDHVFPKAAGRLNGLSHVRAMAIGAAGNQSIGRTVEKAMKQRADTAPGGKRIRMAGWLTIGKAAGYAGWESLPEGDAPANDPAVAALFAYLATLGIHPPAGALELGLTAYTLTRIR